MLTNTKNAEHMMWASQELDFFKFHLKVKNFLFCHSVEGQPVCSDILFDGLPLIWTRRHEGALWRFSVGITSPHSSFFTLWATPEELKMHPKRLTQSAACNIS